MPLRRVNFFPFGKTNPSRVDYQEPRPDPLLRLKSLKPEAVQEAGLCQGRRGHSGPRALAAERERAGQGDSPVGRGCFHLDPLPPISEQSFWLSFDQPTANLVDRLLQRCLRMFVSRIAQLIC